MKKVVLSLILVVFCLPLLAPAMDCEFLLLGENTPRNGTDCNYVKIPANTMWERYNCDHTNQLGESWPIDMIFLTYNVPSCERYVSFEHIVYIEFAPEKVPETTDENIPPIEELLPSDPNVIKKMKDKIRYMGNTEKDISLILLTILKLSSNKRKLTYITDYQERIDYLSDYLFYHERKFYGIEELKKITDMLNDTAGFRLF